MNLHVNLAHLRDQPPRTVICRSRGWYGLYVVVPVPVGEIGRCPDCEGTEFADVAGWLECTNCHFAVLRKHLEQEMR